MPRFACPGCRNILSAGETQRGEILGCEECGKKVRVPLAKPATSKPVSEPQAAVRAAKAAPRSAPPDLPGDRVTAQPPKVRTRGQPAAAEPDHPPPLPAKKRRREEEEDELDDVEDEEAEEGGQDEDAPRGKKKKKKRRDGSHGGAVVASGIGGLVVLAIFILVLTGKWVDLIWEPVQRFLENQGIHPLLAIGITAGVFFVPLTLWQIASTKSAILAGLPHMLKFRPTRPENFEELDVASLREGTEEVEDLGFEHLLDYTVKSDVDGGTGFGRLFVDRENHVLAELNQVFHPNVPDIPLRCVFISLLEDGWSLSTTNRAPSKESWILRRPRAPWRSLPDEENLGRLLKTHLKARQRLLEEMDLAVEEELDEQLYFEREKEANRERNEIIRGRWAIALYVDMWLYSTNPKFEWVGEAG